MTKKGNGNKQHGGWFWQETDPYTGGIVKAVKHYVKPHHIVDVAGYAGMPYAKPLSIGLQMAGYGHSGRKMRGRGSNQPNTSDFGACKF
jgi:hypothetical protein